MPVVKSSSSRYQGWVTTTTCDSIHKTMRKEGLVLGNVYAPTMTKEGNFLKKKWQTEVRNIKKDDKKSYYVRDINQET